MATGKVTKTTVESLSAPADGKAFLWDRQVAGFGVYVTLNGTRIYILQYRLGGRGYPTRRYTIGRHGSPWTPERARDRARELLYKVHQGIDPLLVEQQARLKRIATCSISVESPLDPEAQPTHWIFVDESDLDHEMLDYEEEQALRTAQSGKPLEMLAEGTHNDCAAWLMKQFEDPACPCATKEQFFEGARTKFGYSLSERGFLRAWGAATLDYPDRRRSGPRLERQNSAR